jgi:DNA-binding NtrC family response regulator
VGAQRDVEVDVRVISATNQDIDALVVQQRFRDDLFYRLNVFRITLPPLAERRDDIPLLAVHFLEKHRGAVRSSVARLSPGAMDALMAHSWPGNVRELENVIQAGCAIANGTDLTTAEVEQCLVRLREDAGEVTSVETLWQKVLARETPASLVEFRNLYGERALCDVLRRALEVSRDIRSAGVLLGFIQDGNDEQAYARLRQWLSRRGLTVRKRRPT